MKQKLSKQLQLFLKKNSRKNKLIISAKANLILFFLFSGAFTIIAQTADLKVVTAPNYIIYCNISDVDTLQLNNSLTEGFESQILFQVKLFKKREKPFSFFGDEMIEELEIIKNAEFDIFTDSFKIITDNSNVLYLNNFKDFLDEYLQNKIEFSPENFIIRELNTYYVKIKVSLINKLYIEPFNIFYLLNYKYRITTGWVTSNITQESR